MSAPKLVRTTEGPFAVNPFVALLVAMEAGTDRILAAIAGVGNPGFRLAPEGGEAASGRVRIRANPLFGA